MWIICLCYVLVLLSAIGYFSFKMLCTLLLLQFLTLQGYLKALGMPRTAQVKRDARIGEAEARRDAGVKVDLVCHNRNYLS